MKNINRTLIVAAVFFTCIARQPLHAGDKQKAAAPSPRARFNAAVEKLKAAPGDDAARETVLKLAHALKPAPATPPEALKLMGKGEYLVGQAKQPSDFLAAADAFGAASNIAPWNASIYYNQGVIYEKAEKADLATAAFNWYLKAAPDAPDTADVIKRLGGLEIAAQTQAKSNDQKAILQAEFDRLKPLVDGKTFGNYLSCTYCTKAKSPGNWEGNNSFTLTGSIAIVSGEDPRLEISFSQSGTETKYNGTNYIFFGRPTQGSRELTWKLKSRAWGKNDANWFSPEAATWLYVSSEKLKWCGAYQGSECETIPLGARDPWAGNPDQTLVIYDMDRR